MNSLKLTLKLFVYFYLILLIFIVCKHFKSVLAVQNDQQQQQLKFKNSKKNDMLQLKIRTKFLIRFKSEITSFGIYVRAFQSGHSFWGRYWIWGALISKAAKKIYKLLQGNVGQKLQVGWAFSSAFLFQNIRFFLCVVF